LDVLGEKKIVEMLFRKFPYAYCFCEDFAHLFDYSPAEVALTAPEHSVFSRFRDELIQHKIHEQLFGELNRQLEGRGLIVKRGEKFLFALV